MTDKPLGKLQSDLENERACHSSARLPVIIFQPRKEASRRVQTCINRCRNVCIAAGWGRVTFTAVQWRMARWLEVCSKLWYMMWRTPNAGELQASGFSTGLKNGWNGTECWEGGLAGLRNKLAQCFHWFFPFFCHKFVLRPLWRVLIQTFQYTSGALRPLCNLTLIRRSLCLTCSGYPPTIWSSRLWQWKKKTQKTACLKLKSKESASNSILSLFCQGILGSSECTYTNQPSVGKGVSFKHHHDLNPQWKIKICKMHAAIKAAVKCGQLNVSQL